MHGGWEGNRGQLAETKGSLYLLFYGFGHLITDCPQNIDQVRNRCARIRVWDCRYLYLSKAFTEVITNIACLKQ